MSTFTRVNTNQLLGPSDERGDAVDYGLGDRWYETDTGLSFEVAWDATMEKKVWREGTSQKPVVMDGDFGELSVWFAPQVFRDVARIMRPKQADIQKQAA